MHSWKHKEHNSSSPFPSREQTQQKDKYVCMKALLLLLGFKEKMSSYIVFLGGCESAI